MPYAALKRRSSTLDARLGTLDANLGFLMALRLFYSLREPSVSLTDSAKALVFHF